MERSLQLGVVYPEIEQELLKVELAHPKGNWGISRENDSKWREVLNRYLVYLPIMKCINGGITRCSAYCSDEKNEKYYFKDTARFPLSNC